MMRSNAESLMAGAGAIYLYFDTESMRNIIQSLMKMGYIATLQWGESLFKTNGI